MDGEPWFVAADVCRVLEIGNPTMALGRLDEDERTLISIEGASNGLPVNCVNEPGLYSLIFGSRKPEAKAFKRWVTHEVLPAIRMYGGYVTPRGIEAMLLAPEMVDKLAQAMRARGIRGRRLALPEAQERLDALKRGIDYLLTTDAVIRRNESMAVLRREPVYALFEREGFGRTLGLRALDGIYPLRRDGYGKSTVLMRRGGVAFRVIVIRVAEISEVGG